MVAVGDDLGDIRLLKWPASKIGVIVLFNISMIISITTSTIIITLTIIFSSFSTSSFFLFFFFCNVFMIFAFAGVQPGS